MLKKIKERRIEQFKKVFPDYKVSDKTGSLYTKIGAYESKKSVKINGRAVTKNTLGNLGKTFNWVEHNCHCIYLITPAGKLMVKNYNNNFKTVTLKSVQASSQEIDSIFFIGKKYEYLKSYPNLFPYRFFQNFKSLSDAKKHLGYSFISDEDFYSLFVNNSIDYLSVMILAKEKKNAVRLLKEMSSETADTLKDYIEMCQENNLPIEIPAGKNKLEELHDSAMWEINRKSMNSYSKEYRYDIEENFTDVWRERGLDFRRLETPYEMYAQGIKQIHCIGTNYAGYLGSNAFYSFKYEDKEYEIQIYQNGTVGQFYGRKNTPVPTQLRDNAVKNIDLKYKLKDLKPGLEDYPRIKETDKVEQCEMQIPW